jgi:hypothetical protein
MNKRLQNEYKKLDREACARLDANLGYVLPDELVRLILSYLTQYGRYTFSRLNLRVRYWQHIDVALCYSSSMIFIATFEMVDEYFKFENKINKNNSYVYNDSINAHVIFRKHMFEWHGKRLCVNGWIDNQ